MMMSAAANNCARSTMIFAPLAAYSASGKPAAAPAPASTMTSIPALTRLGMTMGTSATRRSPGYVSRGTPTIITLPPLSSYRVTHSQYRQSETNGLAFPSRIREFSSRGPRQEMNGFHIAAGVDPKLAAMGATATRPLILYAAGHHTELQILHANLPKSN